MGMIWLLILNAHQKDTCLKDSGPHVWKWINSYMDNNKYNCVYVCVGGGGRDLYDQLIRWR